MHTRPCRQIYTVQKWGPLSFGGHCEALLISILCQRSTYLGHTGFTWNIICEERHIIHILTHTLTDTHTHIVQYSAALEQKSPNSIVASHYNLNTTLPTHSHLSLSLSLSLLQISPNYPLRPTHDLWSPQSLTEGPHCLPPLQTDISPGPISSRPFGLHYYPPYCHPLPVCSNGQPCWV